MQTQLEIANDWVRYAEEVWWSPSFRDEIKLSEHLKQVLSNLDTASKSKDVGRAFREIERIRYKAISMEPFESGVALRRCGQIALKMGFISEAADLFRLSQFDIGREQDHYFAVINWMQGVVSWLLPRGRHNIGINRWQECIDLFKKLSESRDVKVSHLGWYNRQRKIMVAALEYAIEHDELPPLGDILDRFGLTPPFSKVYAVDMVPEVVEISEKPEFPIRIENFLEIFAVYEEIPAGLPGTVGFNPSTINPTGYDSMDSSEYLEVVQVRIGEEEYRVNSLVAGDNRVNLIREQPHYVLRVRGKSMNKAGIDDGDLVMVRSQMTADNGEIVAAEIVGVDFSRATLKRYTRQGSTIILQAESSSKEFAGKEWVFTPASENKEDGFFIRGVAVAVLKPIA